MTLLGALALGSGGLLGMVGKAGATTGFSLFRTAGTDRYDTAVRIADAAFGTAAFPTPSLSTVILASGANFPDALSASYLAGALHTSILLTNPNALPSSTSQALRAFGTKTVDLVGGPGAVSNAVATEVANLGIAVHRIYNQDGCTACSRYDTMQSVDTFAGTTPGTATVNGITGPTAILATGTNFPDALGGGPLAVADHFPVILTDGSGLLLSPQAAAVIHTDKIANLIVVGGAAALNPTQYLGLNVDLAPSLGRNRSQTAELLAVDAITNYHLFDTCMNVANGFDPSGVGAGLPAGFTPDALTGAVLGGTGMERCPTLITNSPTDPGSVVDYATSEAAHLVVGNVLGGTAAVSDTAVAAIEAAARS